MSTYVYSSQSLLELKISERQRCIVNGRIWDIIPQILLH